MPGAPFAGSGCGCPFCARPPRTRFGRQFPRTDLGRLKKHARTSRPSELWRSLSWTRVADAVAAEFLSQRREKREAENDAADGAVDRTDSFRKVPRRREVDQAAAQREDVPENREHEVEPARPIAEETHADPSRDQPRQINHEGDARDSFGGTQWCIRSVGSGSSGESQDGQPKSYEQQARLCHDQRWDRRGSPLRCARWQPET
jgi:hypothetical protein